MGNEQAGRSEQDGMRGTGKCRGRSKWERTAGDRKAKRTPLVGDVQEYGEFYEERGEDANKVWIL